MEIRVVNKITTGDKSDMIKIMITSSDIVGDLKRDAINKFSLPLSENRIGLYFTPNENEIYLTNDSKRLLSFDGFKPGITVYIKDLGPQIGYTLANVTGYLGPLVFFFCYFLLNGPSQTSTRQRFAMFMSTFHYLKRLLESIYVHISSRGTISIYYLPLLCLYYWIFYGMICGWFIFQHNSEPEDSVAVYKYIFIFLFFCAEIKNLKCHLILRELKIKNTGAKGIPYGEGFECVSCAHYFWELVAWLCFSIFVGSYFCYAFTACGFMIMHRRAEKRHNGYLNLFGDRYPKNRKAFIPYLL